MKAAICTQYGPPHVLEIREVAKPVPKENEVLIKNYATCVSSSDCYIRGFNVSTLLKPIMGLVLGFKKPRQPILGMVFAGEIESVGKRVTNFKVGDAVFGFDRFAFGTYAEYKCISEDGIIVKKSSKMNYKEAAAIPYGGLLSLFYLNKGNMKAGNKILICGASGAVGSTSLQLAKLFGLHVTAVCSNANLEWVKQLGADVVFDYAKDDYLNRNESYDIIFDAVPAGAIKNNVYEKTCKKLISENGCYISVRRGLPKFNKKDLILLNDLFDRGQLKAVIDKTYSLEQIAGAHTYVEGWHKKGNVIVEINAS